MWNFFVWVWKASFQASVIIILTLVIFRENSYLEFETISFTVLMITEYLMTITEISKLHYYLIYCIAGSLACYVLCLIFLNTELHMAELTFQEAVFILLIFAASWCPLFLWKVLRKRIWPSEVEKIMKTTKDNFIARDLYGQSRVNPLSESNIL